VLSKFTADYSRYTGCDKLPKSSAVVKTFFQVAKPRPRPGQNELQSRDHGLEITSLAASIPIGDRAFA